MSAASSRWYSVKRLVSAPVRGRNPVSLVSFGSASGVTRRAIATENRSFSG